MEEVIKEQREAVKKVVTEHGKTVIDTIKVSQLYGGMRGILGFICETSRVMPKEGILFRGHDIPKLEECLPRAKDGCMPLPEGMIWLLMTGKLPTEEEVKYITDYLNEHGNVPKYVIDVMDNLPSDLHPMSHFAIGLQALQLNSITLKERGKHQRTEWWRLILKDCMDVLSKVTLIAAHTYNHNYRKEKGCYEVDCNLDWSANFTKMMGYKDPAFDELIRMYLTIHADHEGGNVSAHACHLVGSALSDPYISFVAGLNGLAGPLHGLANQEVLVFLKDLIKDIGNTPTDEQMLNWLKGWLKPGKVVPGYGHAVLRVTDPRFTTQENFAKSNIKDDPLVNLVHQLYRIVPEFLKSLKKVNNPYPNVDAHSGVLLSHYGMVQNEFYTVLFGVSRAIGLMSQLVWARAFMYPIERPDTTTTEGLLEIIKTKKEAKEKAQADTDGKKC
uniref:Citrate synthase n=1 Tax=Glossina brevipalpis TaxID=37001 RepID=A0A1A9W6K9_9MUSC